MAGPVPIGIGVGASDRAGESACGCVCLCECGLAVGVPLHHVGLAIFRYGWCAPWVGGARLASLSQHHGHLNQ